MVVASYGVVIEKEEQRTSIAFAEDIVISFERASKVAKEAHEVIYDATSREAVNWVVNNIEDMSICRPATSVCGVSVTAISIGKNWKSTKEDCKASRTKDVDSIITKLCNIAVYKFGVPVVLGGIYHDKSMNESMSMYMSIDRQIAKIVIDQCSTISTYDILECFNRLIERGYMIVSMGMIPGRIDEVRVKFISIDRKEVTNKDNSEVIEIVKGIIGV